MGLVQGPEEAWQGSWGPVGMGMGAKKKTLLVNGVCSGHGWQGGFGDKET